MAQGDSLGTCPLRDAAKGLPPPLPEIGAGSEAGKGNMIESTTPDAGDEKTYVIGIDTGGTYTDGVLMEAGSRHLLSTAKHLTTRQDLSLGVTDVLNSLDIPDPSAVSLVGISSTLATNSIAEGKTRDVGLALVGYDEELLEEYDLDGNFTARDFAHFRGGHDSQGKQKDALDLRGITEWAKANAHEFDAFAVSSYFSPLNAEHEELAADAIYRATSKPVVMGSQLSTQLNSVTRATTAAVNASLVSVMQDFIEAVRRALQAKGIDATLMIVKGDGSLMPYTDAIRRPVETIVSGPAASAIGGYYLCNRPSGLMIDVGGTTTDMALIEESSVDVADQGARVGDVETAVKTARIRTACVGCDSWVHYERDGRGLIVGPERVVPLCRMADQFPAIGEQITRLHRIPEEQRQWTDVEFWILRRVPTARRQEHLSEKQRALVSVLEEHGPMSVTALMRELKVHHPVQLQAAPLLRQGYIEKGGLTPTDLLHVQGRMDKWDLDAAREGLAHAAFLFDLSPEEVQDKAFEFIAANIAEEVIVFLAGRDAQRLPEQIDGTWGRWFFEEFLSDKNRLVSVKLISHFPTVGLGAPAEVFIEAVARKLGSELVIPEHHEVANAIGAVAGSIMIEREALLFVQEGDESRSYRVHVAGEQKQFDKEENARKYARSRVTELALEGADAAGAYEPDLSVSVETEGSVERYIAQAVGNPDLSESFGEYHGRQSDEDPHREPEPAE